MIERHHQTGNLGRAFLGGMGLKRGAMVSGIGHDHHNIVVMGVDAADMAFAANRVAEMQGGIVLAENGHAVEEIAFPILGLLTDLDAWTLAAKRGALLHKARERGCAVSDTFPCHSVWPSPSGSSHNRTVNRCERGRRGSDSMLSSGHGPGAVHDPWPAYHTQSSRAVSAPR